MIARNVAPASVMRVITRSRNSAVFLPGRMPGMKEPYSFMFFDISAGLNISEVQKKAKKKIRVMSRTEEIHEPERNESRSQYQLSDEPIMAGNESSADEKITGITPAWFTLMGRKWRWPP